MNPGASGQRRFRYAPTPTRELHVGNGLAALIGWAAARSVGGAFALRIEDIDRTRSRPELAAAALDDLRWLGVDWDEGPDVGGAFGPYVQSERMARYDAALAELDARGLVYACQCSRADVRAAMSAPHLQLGGEAPYAGTCRPTHDGPRALAEDRGGYRLDVVSLGDAAVVQLEDAWLGPVTEDVRETCGDFLLGRPDAPTYQLAVVTDDIAMGITDVVRGHDLAGSTARQVLLYRAFGGAVPRFAHHPLLVDEQGQKLSKRDGALALSELRKSQMAPGELRARLGAAVGLWGADVRRAAARDFIEALREVGPAGGPEPTVDGRPASGEIRAGAWHDGAWPT
ncbi:MAG: tRNA glutamyl-Q(34) synthetase GluQRS [Myxococcota bacterium]